MNSHQVVGLMKGRKRLERPQVGQYPVVDDHRSGVARAPMNHSMGDRLQPQAGLVRAKGCDHRVKCSVMGAHVGVLYLEPMARPSAQDHRCIRPDAVDLARQNDARQVRAIERPLQ
jgi:hypothetical protein